MHCNRVGRQLQSDALHFGKGRCEYVSLLRVIRDAERHGSLIVVHRDERATPQDGRPCWDDIAVTRITAETRDGFVRDTSVVVSIRYPDTVPVTILCRRRLDSWLLVVNTNEFPSQSVRWAEYLASSNPFPLDEKQTKPRPAFAHPGGFVVFDCGLFAMLDSSRNGGPTL